jgi:hypothetical protein
MALAPVLSAAQRHRREGFDHPLELRLALELRANMMVA